VGKVKILSTLKHGAPKKIVVLYGLMKFDSCSSIKWKNCGCGTTGDDVNGGASSKLISGLM